MPRYTIIPVDNDGRVDYYICLKKHSVRRNKKSRGKRTSFTTFNGWYGPRWDNNIEITQKLRYSYVE